MPKDTFKLESDTIVVASLNLGKVSEFTSLLAPLGLKTLGLAEALELLGLTDKLSPPEESAMTFLENAAIKAHYYANALERPTLSDDSGLCVLTLGGAPGVRSARYGGTELSPKERNAYLLSNMEGIKEREAYFQTVLVLARPHDPKVLSWEGTVHGEIALSPKGEGGFGYDPVFFVPSLQKTFGEISLKEKNKLSHRAMAALSMQKDLLRIKDFLKA